MSVYISVIADVLADRLMLIDRENAKTYQRNLDVFQARWTSLIETWGTKAQSLKGQKVVVYHNAWAYLLEWLGMDVLASLEPKPGIPPTASHLETVLNSVQGQKVAAILVAPYEDEKAAEWLSKKSGIPIAHMPFTVGGNDNANNLAELFEDTLRLLKGGS